MSNTTNAQTERDNKTKRTNRVLRWLIAILMALISVGIGWTIYVPAVLVGGMLMDSCSGSVVGWLWVVWLWFLWALVMLVSALVPPVLIAMGRRWRWVLLSMVAGAMVSAVWYLLWYVIAIGAYNLLGEVIC